MGAQALEDFKLWMRGVGITWSEDRISLQAGVGGCSGAAWGITAASDLSEGDLLCTIPKTAILSPKTTAIADLLRKERIGGGLALIAAVMYEYGAGSSSRWHGYLLSLPPREYVPIFWTDAQLARLTGTELQDKPQQDREAMASDFVVELLPLLKKHPHALGPVAHAWTLERFKVAASWVASRAFHVDARHGMAMVPLADVFNHKPSVVALGGEYVVAEEADAEAAEAQQHALNSARQRSSEQGGEGQHGMGQGTDSPGDKDMSGSEEGEEEEKDGEGGSGVGGSASGDGQGEGDGSSGGSGEEEASGDGSDEDDDEDEDEDEGEDEEEEDEDAATDDAGTGGGAGTGLPPGSLQSGCLAPRWQRWQAAGMELRLEIAICSRRRAGVGLLDIVAAQPVAQGKEVHNTYGEHGNAELVNKYAFALPLNPFDEVSLHKPLLLAAARQALGSKQAEARIRFLRKHSELLSEEQGEEPLLITASHPPTPSTCTQPSCSQHIKGGTTTNNSTTSCSVEAAGAAGPVGPVSGASISTPLYVALRVLCAGDDEVKAWGRKGGEGVAGALGLLQTALQAEAQEAGGKGGMGHSCGHDHYHDHDASKHTCAHAHVHDDVKGGSCGGCDAADCTAGADGAAGPPAKRQRTSVMPAAPPAAAVVDAERVADMACGRKAAKHGAHGDREEAEQQEEEGDDAEWEAPEEVQVGVPAAAWTPAMACMLVSALHQRMAVYPCSLEQDMELLQKLQEVPSASCGPGAAADRSEAVIAERCALQLRLGEQRLLQAALAAALQVGKET